MRHARLAQVLLHMHRRCIAEQLVDLLQHTQVHHAHLIDNDNLFRRQNIEVSSLKVATGVHLVDEVVRNVSAVLLETSEGAVEKEEVAGAGFEVLVESCHELGLVGGSDAGDEHVLAAGDERERRLSGGSLRSTAC